MRAARAALLRKRHPAPSNHPYNSTHQRAQVVERLGDALDHAVAAPDDPVAVEDEAVDLGDERGHGVDRGALGCGGREGEKAAGWGGQRVRTRAQRRRVDQAQEDRVYHARARWAWRATGLRSTASGAPGRRGAAMCGGLGSRLVLAPFAAATTAPRGHMAALAGDGATRSASRIPKKGLEARGAAGRGVAGAPESSLLPDACVRAAPIMEGVAGYVESRSGSAARASGARGPGGRAR